MLAMDPYDLLAPHYRELARGRAAYLEAVDRFVVRHAPEGAASLLDVGAGDGVRGKAIGRALQIEEIVLCDSSREMVARCRQLAPSEVWHSAAEDLVHPSRRFDVILCLWNVLGHLASVERRVRALGNMRRLLAPGGAVFLDVNNRHNAGAYGKRKVFGRIILDALDPRESRGNSTFEWNINGEHIPGKGHLFTAREMDQLIAQAGLETTRRVAIDYVTGAASRWFFGGQLVYQLCAPKD